MDDATRAGALAKLRSMRNKIGYPRQWRVPPDAAAMRLQPDAFLANLLALARHHSQRALANIGAPLYDADQWRESPVSLRVHYSPAANDLTFPALLLRPPAYDSARMPVVAKYARCGVMAARQVARAFDRRGRLYAGDGTLTEWMTAASAQRYAAAEACMRGSEHLWAEAVGLSAAWRALPNARSQSSSSSSSFSGNWATPSWRYRGAPSARNDNDENEEEDEEEAEAVNDTARLFFLAYAQMYCTAYNSSEARATRFATRTQPPGNVRVNMAVAQLPAFFNAFGCGGGSGGGNGDAHAPPPNCHVNLS